MFLHLISDDLQSLRQYPQNVLSDFHINLAKPIHLEGEWEMCLHEIQIPHSWHENRQLDFSVHITLSGTFISSTSSENVSFTTDSGWKINGSELTPMNETFKYSNEYFNENISDFIYSFNKSYRIEETTSDIDSILTRLNEKIPYLEFVRNDENYIDINFLKNKAHLITDSYTIHSSGITYLALSDPLRKILGFRNNTFTTSDFNQVNPLIVSSFHPFLPRKLQIIGVHCDLIESQMVSSSYQQILRFVPVERKNDSVSQTNTFLNPLYVPLRKKNFDSIQIRLLDLDLTRVPFEGGVVIACVHFRKKQKNI